MERYIYECNGCESMCRLETSGDGDVPHTCPFYGPIEWRLVGTEKEVLNKRTEKIAEINELLDNFYGD